MQVSGINRTALQNMQQTVTAFNAGLQSGASVSPAPNPSSLIAYESVPTYAPFFPPPIVLPDPQPSPVKPTYVSAVLVDHPVGYWRMDTSSGTLELDQSGNGRNGTIIGGVTLNQSGALSDGDTSEAFNGSTGEIQIGSGLTISGSGACSFEAWAFDTSGTLSDIKALFALSLGSDLFFIDSSKHLKLSLALSSGQKNIAGTAILPTNQWNYLVGTFDGEDVITLYINGVQDKQTTGLAGTLSAVAAITRHIGTDGNGVAARFWQGRLDEVAVYNYALSAAQVLNHYTLAH